MREVDEVKHYFECYGLVNTSAEQNVLNACIRLVSDLVRDRDIAKDLLSRYKYPDTSGQ